MKGPVHPEITAVEIIPKMNRAGLIRPGGPIYEMDRKGGREADPLLLLSTDRIQKRFPAPFRVIPKKILRQVDRFFDPDTAGAEVAHRPAEELPRGRIMEVDIKRVWKNKLHPAQWIGRPRLLSKPVDKIPARDFRPVDPPRRNLLPSMIPSQKDFDFLPFEISNIFLNQWK